MPTVPPARRRFRPPPRVKRWLVPAWNWGVHLARRVGDRAGALARGRVERCSVCGRVALMIYRRRVIPPELAHRWGLTEGLARAVARKESLECSRCGAKLRARRLAEVLLDLFPTAGPLPRSAAAWARTPEAGRLRVAEFNRIEGLHDALGRLSRFEGSDYVEGAAPGAKVAGVRHEDLTRLTHPDESFDLVLTSETLEHVPDLHQALAEIRRVLAPDGVHLFTVPILPGIPKTFPRAALSEDGARLDFAPFIAHPGGDTGYPVFTEFGADFPELVRDAGYAVEVRFGPATAENVCQVHIARKTP